MEEQPHTPVPLPRRKRRNLVPRLKGILYTSTTLKSNGEHPNIASAVFNAAWAGQCIGYPVSNPDESGYAAIQDTDKESEPPSPPPKNIEDIYAVPNKSSTANKQCETSFSDHGESSYAGSFADRKQLTWVRKHACAKGNDNESTKTVPFRSS